VPWSLAAIVKLASLALAWAVAKDRDKDNEVDQGTDEVGGGGLATAEAS